MQIATQRAFRERPTNRQMFNFLENSTVNCVSVFQSQNYAFYLRANLNKILSEFFFENPRVLEFILNFFSFYRIFKKIALKTLWAERRQHAKREEKKLPSESGNNAAESFKFLNILTRQGRQLRMLRVLTRERTRKTHRTFYFRIFCSIHFVGYPVQIVQLYFGQTFRIAIS